MKIKLKLLSIVFIISMLVYGCLKNDDYEPCQPRTLEQDMPAMTKFAADSSINTTQDASGLLYEIIDQGTGAVPTAGSRIVAKYTGRNLKGELFDSGQFPQPYPLSTLIQGWQIGIPKIRVGGKIKLIIPSSLAYGCYTNDARVLNQPLYFHVELISVE